MSLLSSLCQANRAILQHKLVLMTALTQKHGVDTALQIYQQTCPIVHASIGQHMRHSLDHMEKAINATQEEEIRRIYYDQRQRGTPAELDWNLAETRIQELDRTLIRMSDTFEHISVLDHPVEANFMLSGDSDAEVNLPSTVARELGFCAHHAIHHMAMLRIIAVNPTVGNLSGEDLPGDFGRAPSTVNFDQKIQAAK